MWFVWFMLGVSVGGAISYYVIELAYNKYVLALLAWFSVMLELEQRYPEFNQGKTLAAMKNKYKELECGKSYRE